MKISVSGSKYELVKFVNEAELEEVVMKFSTDIFGEKSIYLDIKKRVKHPNNSFVNIPDAYVIDFRDEPKLWVVENELSTHDSFRHIGVQMLQFASQFTDGSFEIKTLLLDAINESSELKKKVELLLKNGKYPNISEALDCAVYKNEFGFVIVIDEITEDLSRVTRELARQPELLQLQKYVSGKDVAYAYDELLKEVDEAKSAWVREISDIDTMVAPAKAEGHKKAFLEQKAWWAVRISPTVIPRLKYLAMYEVRPISAIRWVGKIQAIKPYEDTGKYKIYLSEIYEIEPIKLGSPKNAPYSPRYTSYELLQKAKTLGDL
jgi:hypothetical protein